VARSNDRDRKRSTKDLRDRRGKKKVCIFCKEHTVWVDYKDINVLRRFMSDRGKIRARRVSGNCAQHQREVAVAIKTARELALLPYTQRTVTERTGPRGGRGRPGGDDRPSREAPDAVEAELAALPTEFTGDADVDVDVDDVAGIDEVGGDEDDD
jgi:small subunit ribosomal protein S18